MEYSDSSTDTTYCHAGLSAARFGVMFHKLRAFLHQFRNAVIAARIVTQSP